ncbi:MAG TPA: rod-binding protein [Spirochaetia bacterium]|nr:rod-binding protein [Spirochaetia bacterium]
MQTANIGSVHPYPLEPSRTVRPPVDKNSELYKACVDFESLFVRQMLEVMRKTIHREDDLLNGGLTQDVFEGMLYDQYARKMAETAGFGLADTIYRQVSSK